MLSLLCFLALYCSVAVEAHYSTKKVINECASNSSFVSDFCGEKASCRDEVNGFSCQCNDGYFATTERAKSYCEDVDECALGTSGCDLTNGFCVDWFPPVKFRCGCNPGYVCSNTACTRCARDVLHSCNLNNGGCDINARCNAFPNNRSSCTCAEGYTGDGFSCTIDTSGVVSPTPAPFASCGTVEWTCPFPASNCTTSNGHPYCKCNDGFFAPGGIGGSCIDIDECRTASLNNCASRSICTNFPGTFRCSCASGTEKFPGTLEGTDCRTRAEIRDALNAGSFYTFTTGIDGLTVEEFSAPAIQAIYMQSLESTIGVKFTDYSFSNVTTALVGEVMATSFTITIRIGRILDEGAVIQQLQAAETEIESDINKIDTFVIYGLEVQDSSVSKQYLENFISALTLAANGQNRRLQVFIGGVAYFYNFGPISGRILVLAFRVRNTIAILIVITRFDSRTGVTQTSIIDIDGILNPPPETPRPTPVPTRPPTFPTPKPSASRRYLVEEEENFFEVADDTFDSPTSEQSENQALMALWKEEFSLNRKASMPVNIVISHCDNNLGWFAGSMKGLNINSITVISKCGTEVKGLNQDFHVIQENNVGRNDGSYLLWITTRLEEIDPHSIVLFMKDTQSKRESSRSISDMLDTVATREFACGNAAVDQDPFSASVYHDSETLGKFSMSRYDSINKHYGEDEQFKSRFKNLAEWRKVVGYESQHKLLEPVCYGGVFAVSSKKLFEVGDGILNVMLGTLTRGNNVEEEHFMERTWASMLTKPMNKQDEEKILNFADMVDENTSGTMGTLLHRKEKRSFSPFNLLW